MNQAYKANKLKILNCFTVPMQVLRPYETRYDRNTVAALIINGMYPGHVKILNIGSGGKRHLAAQLKNKTVVDLDIAGDVDYLINLEVDPLKFQNNEFDIVVALDYNTPRKLDRLIRCMLSCQKRGGGERWKSTCGRVTMRHLRPELPWRH